MSDPDLGRRAERLLGSPALQRTVDRLVRRLERGGSLTGTLTLPDATDDERSALGALLGRGPASSVRLEALDDVVRTSGTAGSLAEALEALRGPVLVRGRAAEEVARAWDDAFAVLATLLHTRPEYATWAERLRAAGLVRRLAGTPEAGASLLARTAAVLAALPVQGEPLAVLAARVLGDAHALDRDRPESTLVLSAVHRGAPARGADARRRAWAGAGVALDSLSSTVLVHRLPLARTPLADLTEAGEPVVLTLRQLGDPALVALPSGAVVSVCENPSVVEATAMALGPACGPLVCVSGQPSLAALLLLTRLAEQGARLRYHGDFDWGGLRIAKGLYERVPFAPWRYGAADLIGREQDEGAPLVGAPVDAPWDAGLRSALERRGRRLEEEQVLDELLADLAAANRASTLGTWRPS